MKKHLVLSIAILLTIHCICQNISDTWLPEKYVLAAKSGDTLANRYLIPIEGFESHSDRLYMLTYRGELNPIQTEQIMVNGEYKNKILAFGSFINLKYNSMDLVTRLSNASVFISKFENKLIIEINERDKVEITYFINNIGDYKFKSVKSAKEYLLK